MRHLVLTTKFKQLLLKRANSRANLQECAERTLKQIETDAITSALNTRRLKGELNGLYACSCNCDLNFIFSIEKDAETRHEVIVLLNIVSNEDLEKKYIQRSYINKIVAKIKASLKSFRNRLARSESTQKAYIFAWLLLILSSVLGVAINNFSLFATLILFLFLNLILSEISFLKEGLYTLKVSTIKGRLALATATFFASYYLLLFRGYLFKIVRLPDQISENILKIYFNKLSPEGTNYNIFLYSDKVFGFLESHATIQDFYWYLIAFSVLVFMGCFVHESFKFWDKNRNCLNPFRKLVAALSSFVALFLGRCITVH
ncbi:MAG: hypothetical protein WA902_02170, partial [Thermosynechococcaceae cyanobacterium]